MMEAALGLATRASSTTRELSRAAKATLREVRPIDSHSEAMELELGKQVHSMDQPAFAERLAQLQSRISGKS
jgi:enoyl-CoA hydratase